MRKRKTSSFARPPPPPHSQLKSRTSNPATKRQELNPEDEGEPVEVLSEEALRALRNRSLQDLDFYPANGTFEGDVEVGYVADELMGMSFSEVPNDTKNDTGTTSSSSSSSSSSPPKLKQLFTANNGKLGVQKPGDAFDAMFKRALEGFKKKYKEQLKQNRYQNLERCSTQHLYENQPNLGALKERRLRDAIAGMGLVLEPHQKRFHEIAIDALRPLIYGDEYDKIQAKLLTFRGKKRVKPWINCLTPRRFGKTVMVAMLAAALVAILPITIGIFSTNQRVSTILMNTAMTFLTTIPGAVDRIRRRNQKQIQLTHGKVGLSGVELIGCINSYSANKKGVRGFTVDVILVDEAAFVPQDMFTEAIYPALSTSNVVYIAITTAQDENNIFTQQMRLMDPESDYKETLFEQFVVRLSCQKCQEAGIPDKCTHPRDKMPKWKPGSNSRRVQALYGKDKAKLHQQELLGLVVESDGAVFKKEWIANLVARMGQNIPLTGFRKPRVLYSYIDPHGGADTSDQVYVTFAIVHSKIVVSFLVFRGSWSW